ncbi:uncharacterized protein LOC133537270 [Nerophis ophidion]|uniref:uncharacterized protein LOC133537270 n=1 Tax=Nerophis ophidion TaxID=159077 RepID=UPI002ADFF4D6|nr:uncharacterized protein LOC133537270 [Nerophis ophidion]
MRMQFYFTLLCLWLKKDSVNCMGPLELRSVALGDSVTLKCSYNCSTGFVRGCWSKASVSSDCLGETSKDKNDFCTVALILANVSAEDLKYNYSCYTQARDHPDLKQKIERVVILKAQTTAMTSTVPPSTKNGKLAEIHVLATFSLTVVVALIALAVYICVNHNRCRGNGDDAVSRSGSPLHSQVVFSPVNDTDEGQTEVPYADIMIAVRGVSTPELTQVNYLTTEEPRQWRGCESRGHLQASRSADRLHLPQPREVSRKMSSNSEYAVIMYA